MSLHCPIAMRLVLQSLGVFEAVNYKNQDIAELYKDPSTHFDVVVDLVGGQHFNATPPHIRSQHTQTHLANPNGWIETTDCRVSASVEIYLQMQSSTCTNRRDE